MLVLCLPQFYPLNPVPCSEGEGCYPSDDPMTCAPDASEPELGGAFDACEVVNACNPGLFCANAETVGACEESDASSCTPWCDLAAPDCPTPTTCQPYFTEGLKPPGYESTGYCGQETQ